MIPRRLPTDDNVAWSIWASLSKARLLSSLFHTSEKQQAPLKPLPCPAPGVRTVSNVTDQKKPQPQPQSAITRPSAKPAAGTVAARAVFFFPGIYREFPGIYFTAPSQLARPTGECVAKPCKYEAELYFWMLNPQNFRLRRAFRHHTQWFVI